MERTLAATWATLAFLVVVGRGALRAEPFLATVQLGLALAVAFMVVGFGLGLLARIVVEESVRQDRARSAGPPPTG